MKKFGKKSLILNGSYEKAVVRPSLLIYQYYARLYLDEYLEQEELRKNWFEKNHDVFKHIYTRFLHRK